MTNQRSGHSTRILTAISAALWLGVLIFALRNPASALFGDSSGYLTLAHNLWTNGVFSGSTAAPFVPEIFRVPGYPFFLGFFSDVLDLPLRGLIFIHWMSGVCAVLLCRKWLGASPAWAWLACDLVVLMHTTRIMTEALYLPALLFTCYITHRCFRDGRKRVAAAAGLLWGTLLLIKPLTIFLPLLFAALLLSRPRGRFLIFLGLAYLPAALWGLRNQQVTDHFFLSSQGGLDLLRYPAASVEALRLNRSREELELELKAAVDTREPSVHEDLGARNRAYGKAAVEILKAHPFLTIRYCLSGAARMLGGTGIDMIPPLTGRLYAPGSPGQVHPAAMSGEGTLALLKHFPILVPVQAGYWASLLVLYFFYFKGVWAVWRAGQRTEALFFLIGPAYLIAVSCHQGYYRYRIPLMPFLVAGAARGLASLHLNGQNRA